MNKALFGFAIFPLFCIGVILLTGLVIVFALRRGTRTINEKVKEYGTTSEKINPSADDRWARGDLKGSPQNIPIGIEMQTCPACGGENSKGSSVCAFCGRSLG